MAPPLEPCQPFNTRVFLTSRLDQEQQSRTTATAKFCRNAIIPCMLLKLCPTPRQKRVWKAALFTFQQHNHVLPWLMWFRQVMYICCFPLQMRNLGMTIELNPQGDKITCPAFGLYSFPTEYSTIGHIVLDLTSITYQPATESRERTGHPRRHVTLCHVRAKTGISSSHTNHT